VRLFAILKNGGVGERLKPAVLKFARLYSHLIQITNLRHTVLHQNGVFWAVLVNVLCNSGYFFDADARKNRRSSSV
jgi:hypothetical protein